MVNLSVLFGIIAAVVVMVGTFVMSHLDSAVFMNAHAILIVIGGTFAATFLCFSWSNITAIFKAVVNKVLLRKNQSVLVTIEEITDLAKNYRTDPNHLKDNIPKIKNPFLAEALELAIHGGVTGQKLSSILKMRSKTLFERYEEDAQIFKVVSKFPPAFGLMGTTLGMISLMQGMGGADGIEGIGPAMGVALVATFYGIALSNLFFIPLGEHLAKLNRHDALIRKIITDGVMMVLDKQHHFVVNEYLKSYLLPGERKKQKSLQRDDVQRKAA